jgi:hypothetical protein
VSEVDVWRRLDLDAGDAIAVRVPKEQYTRELGEELDRMREQGIRIVAFTDEVELRVIKDFHSYLLQFHHPLSIVQIEQIRSDWLAAFPNAPVAILAGEATISESESEDNLDTL